MRGSEFLQQHQQAPSERGEGAAPLDGGASEYPVVTLRARDFTVEAARKRLSLMHGLISELAGCELTEREALLYIEHIVPREQTHALRAMGGLLAYLQKNDVTVGSVSLTELKRYEVERQLYLSPEAFLALNIFEDARHPSAHGMRSDAESPRAARGCGMPACTRMQPQTVATRPCACCASGGRGKEGFSIWGLMNRTKSKPGERMLRSWFARCTPRPTPRARTCKWPARLRLPCTSSYHRGAIPKAATA